MSPTLHCNLCGPASGDALIYRAKFQMPRRTRSTSSRTSSPSSAPFSRPLCPATAPARSSPTPSSSSTCRAPCACSSRPSCQW
eukprot:15131993-Alexandrium_andersonii.AAC.1